MKYKYKSFSESDLLHGIKQAENKIKAYKRELQYRRNYRATRCNQDCGKRSIPREYTVLRDGYGMYKVLTFLCEEEHRLSNTDLKGLSVVEELEDNQMRIVPQEELDDFSRKLYGERGGVEI